MKQRRDSSGRVRPEYWVWNDMKRRCQNPTHHAWRNYGGRGIHIDPAWESFEVFFVEMGSRPSSKHTIQRKDNDLGYSKANCCWALRVEQADNRRNSQHITYRGETHSAAEWCRRLGLTYRTVQQRVGKLKWPHVRALTEPKHVTGKACHAH